jgi:lipopolysaccharide/colanic/teichoic acid biosynthesis glycosyltransferase
MLMPVIVVIAVAIKLEDGGSVLYKQKRTVAFGNPFPLFEFWSMIQNAKQRQERQSATRTMTTLTPSHACRTSFATDAL